MGPKQGVFREIQRGIETENYHQVVTQVFRVKAWALVAPASQAQSPVPRERRFVRYIDTLRGERFSVPS